MRPVVHVFNSSVVSGPETLVLPALKGLKFPSAVVFLTEARKAHASSKPPEYARSLGLEVHEIPVRSRLDRHAIQELSDLFLKLKPGIIHAHDVKASTYVQKASVLGGSKSPYFLASTHHGVMARPGLKLKIYERYYSHFILPRFDRVLAVSNYDGMLLRKRWLGDRKIRVHLNGVDRAKTEMCDRDQVSAKIRSDWGLDQHGIPSNAILLGVVGRLEKEKRHDVILRVFSLLIQSPPELPIHLLCFGTGSMETQLKHLTRQMGLEKRVHWMGYRNGIGSEFAGFDLLLSLSSGEGLPINLLEAGWAGTPVVATAVGGNVDVIATSEMGILVDPREAESATAEKIRPLLLSEEIRTQMGAALQKQVESRFSQKAWLTRLEEIYAEMVG